MNDTDVAEQIARLQDASDAVRRDAARWLAKAPDPSAVVALDKALSDKDMFVRRDAAEALGHIGRSSSVPAPIIRALQRALHDENWFVLERAAEALTRIGVPAIPALITALQDASQNVRFNAALALGDIGELSAVPALVQASHDQNEFVGRNAMEALGKIGDAITLPRLILADSRLSPHERIDLLHKVRHARYMRNGKTERYRYVDSRALCMAVLNEGDSQFTTGARAVLNWIDGGHILLRGSQRDNRDDAQALLRGVQGAPLKSRPDAMLRAADEPAKGAAQSLPPMSSTGSGLAECSDSKEGGKAHVYNAKPRT